MANGRERLERAVNVLRAVAETPIPNVEFNMDQWIMGHTAGEGWACGTKACAVGHLALDPWFNEQGMSITKQGASFKISFEPESFLRDTEPSWHYQVTMRESAAFFGIAIHQASEFFGQWLPEDVENPNAVADKIEAYLARHPVAPPN